MQILNCLGKESESHKLGNFVHLIIQSTFYCKSYLMSIHRGHTYSHILRSCQDYIILPKHPATDPLVFYSSFQVLEHGPNL